MKSDVSSMFIITFVLFVSFVATDSVAISARRGKRPGSDRPAVRYLFPPSEKGYDISSV